jgi:hypothetical protein
LKTGRARCDLFLAGVLWLLSLAAGAGALVLAELGAPVWVFVVERETVPSDERRSGFPEIRCEQVRTRRHGGKRLEEIAHARALCLGRPVL